MAEASKGEDSSLVKAEHGEEGSETTINDKRSAPKAKPEISQLPVALKESLMSQALMDRKISQQFKGDTVSSKKEKTDVDKFYKEQDKKSSMDKTAAKSVNKERSDEKKLDTDNQNIQENLSQQPVSETKTAEKDGSHESIKPIPAERRKRKKESTISRSISTEDGNQFDNNFERAEGKPAVEACGACSVEKGDGKTDHPKTETLEVERWKLDMLDLANIQGLKDKHINISSKENVIVIKGDADQVAKICNMIFNIEKNIAHRQITLRNDPKLIEFLKRETVTRYVRELLDKKKLNCHWELNKKRPVIDVYVYQHNRVNEALAIIENCYCEKKISRVDNKVLYHLCRSTQWQKKIDNLRTGFNEKVEYMLSDNGFEIVVLCTRDLETLAVDQLQKTETLLKENSLIELEAGKFMLLHQKPLEYFHGVKVTALLDQTCFIFDGEEGDVQKAKLAVYRTVSKIKHEEVQIPTIVLSFLKRDAVVKAINKRLESKELKIYWEVNATNYVIDVFGFDDEKLHEACDTIEQSYRVQQFDFCKNSECFEQFKSKIVAFKEKNLEKIEALVDDNSAIIISTPDLLSEIKELRNSCETITTAMEFPCKETAVLDFLRKHPQYVDEIKSKYSVALELCDFGEECSKFVVTGRKEKLEAAKKAMESLISQKISKEVIHISQETSHRIQNSEYDSVCEEFKIHMEFKDVKFNVQDNEIILTNRQYKPDGKSKSAIVVPKEDIEDSNVEVRETEAHCTIYCSSKNTKLGGGKNVQKLEKMFENILDGAEKRGFSTLLIPVDELIGFARPKFVKLFLQTYWKFSQGKERHIPDIVIQDLDRSTFQPVRAAVSKFLNSLQQGIAAVSTRIHMTQTIRIQVEEGELASKKANVIVNSVGKELKLSAGAVSQSLLGAAGQSLQSEVSRKCPGGLAGWQMVETDGYKLRCSKVYHVVLEGYHHESTEASMVCLQALKSLICDCLYTMDKSGFRSIAFPVLGTGNLGYQAKDVADVMVTAVEEYSRNNPSTSIEEATIVVFGKRNKKVFDERLQRYPKHIRVEEAEEAEEAKEESDQYELVIVGLKDDVAKAKANLIKRFREEEKEESKEAKKAKTKAVKQDKRQTPDSSSTGLEKTLNARKLQSPEDSVDISELDKLLHDVKVELKGNFIRKLPDNSILSKLGWFKVKIFEEENKYWVTGKLADLEEVESFLKTVIKSSPAQQYQIKDISREAYDLVCSKFERFQDRISYDTNTNKVTILKLDKEIEECIEKYNQYQFDEIIPKSDDSTSGFDAYDAENDKKTAECLKLENNDQYRVVEFYISPEDSVLKIAAPEYTILTAFKFALEVRTKRKQVRGRHGRTEAPTVQMKHATEEQQPENQHTRSTRDKCVFKTMAGIHVYVYKHDILKLKVDCIVNAANREMEHGGGVAKVIARAAGYELDRESKEFIYKNGYLRVGACCTTTAGKLGYDCVIHTVGPDIQYYEKRAYSKMRADLKKAVRVCFEEAEKRGLSSIGMTSISSGVYGVPKDWCAEEYAAAVQEYSKYCGRKTTLKEIHFVDVNDEMLAAMNKIFQLTFMKSSDIEDSGDYETDRRGTDSGSGQRKFGKDIHRKRGTDQSKHQYSNDAKKWFFEMNNTLNVIVYTGNITDFKTGAIACRQDKDLRSIGGIVAAIKRKAGELYQNDLRKHSNDNLQTGEVVVTEPGSLRCAAIYHVITQHFTESMTQGAFDEFLKGVHLGYVKCLHTANRRGLFAIAIPLFGCGVLSQKIDKLTETFLSAVKSYCSDTAGKESKLQEIHAINDREGVTHKIKTVFWDYTENMPRTKKGDASFHQNNFPTDSFSSKIVTPSPERDEKNDDESNFPDADITAMSADEECPICMDKFDNPKKLTKCGHVFCADCIEAQFKVTPKCPNCSTVYGIITGDQPKGEMKHYIDRTTKLRGYDGVNTIVITYSFPDGVQERDHPQPGTRYKGITRKGYLPDNKEGRLIFEMLKIAFERKLVFTIGSSRTTGHEGVITWNDIHHKTDHRPHSTFGYPDPSYLGRVKDELAAKGVTPDDIPQLSH